jgi:predicted porin
MKKSLVALAVLAASGAAMAQSSVTLFGVVDAGYSVGNGSVSDSTAMRTDRIGSSRLGFRGVEDLGGGMRAEFWLEAGVANDSGAGSATNSNNQAVTGLTSAGTQGLTFNRKSTVGLVGKMGEIRLGRDYSPQFYPDAQYDPFGTNGVASSLIAYGGGFAAVRASNMIAYHSPDFGGIRVMLGSYMGENNTGAAAGKAGDGNGIHVRYAKGPLALGIASSTTKSGAATEVKTSTMGGSYNFGVATVMFNSNTVSNTGAVDIEGMLIGAAIPMAGGTLKFSNASLKQGAAETKRNAVGFVKPLSKRTSLFATYARNGNSGGANRGLNGAVTGANASSTGYDLGVNHTF